jgi:hypothetical protein
MAEPLRHRQTKGAETDMFYLTPPRHISTLPIATVSKCPRYVRFSSDSEQIADVPTCRIKCAPAARETACEPQVHPCAEQRSRTSRTRAPVALTDPSEPWWTKPVHALQLQGLSWASDHRPWSCERVLYSLHRRVLAVLHLDPIGASPAAIGAIDAPISQSWGIVFGAAADAVHSRTSYSNATPSGSFSSNHLSAAS